MRSSSIRKIPFQTVQVSILKSHFTIRLCVCRMFRQVLFPKRLHHIKSLLCVGVAMFTGGQCRQKCLFGCTWFIQSGLIELGVWKLGARGHAVLVFKNLQWCVPSVTFKLRSTSTNFKYEHWITWCVNEYSVISDHNWSEGVTKVNLVPRWNHRLRRKLAYELAQRWMWTNQKLPQKWICTR